MKFLCALIFASTTTVFCQQRSASTQVQSSGACSPNIISNQGRVRFTCKAALDEMTTAKIVSLLNQILRNEGSAGSFTDDSNRKLDEVLTFLKSPPPIERIEKFAVMVPFDTSGSSPIPHDENSDDPLLYTYWDLASLAGNGTVPASARESKGTGQITWQSEPVGTADAPVFLGRLLQYYILQSIDRIERNSITTFVGYPAEARAGIEPPDAEPYPREKLFRELADNHFFKPFAYRDSEDEMSWKVKPVLMPKETEIRLLTDTEKGPLYVVRLERREHFKIEYLVENLAGTGPPSVPKNFATTRANTTMQWAFFITMRYEIQRRAEPDFHPDKYVQWADALYSGLQDRLDESKQPTHIGRVR